MYKSSGTTTQSNFWHFVQCSELLIKLTKSNESVINSFINMGRKSYIAFHGDKIKSWKCYVDDTIAFFKTDAIKNLLLSLNSYHSNIQFTMKIEQNNQIPFFDVLLISNAMLMWRWGVRTYVESSGRWNVVVTFLS